MSDERISITASSTYAANTVAILQHAILDPSTMLVIVPAKKIKSPDPEKEPDVIVASPHFLTVLRYVVGLTLLLTLIWGLIAFFISTETDNRKEVFWVLGHLVTLGWGAIFGLLGGKQLN